MITGLQVSRLPDTVQRRLHQDVVAHYTGLIVAGDLPPDTTLPTEAAIGDELGVSRIVVREAMRLLSARGLVQVRHGVKTRIAPPENWDVLDRDVLRAYRQSPAFDDLIQEILEARELIEAAAAELAARRGSQLQKQTIQNAWKALEAVSSGDVARLAECEVAFHQSILEVLGNRILRRTVKPLFETLRFLIAEIPYVATQDSTIRRQHAEIVDAIVRGDPERARQAMVDHMVLARATIHMRGKRIEQRTLDEDSLPLSSVKYRADGA
ncbi:MAG: FadR family transcriptional regulator [Actinobacteria bacterium]|nr:FadR family transcriptional regulator [Actinomycetota bacterium]